MRTFNDYDIAEFIRNDQPGFGARAQRHLSGFTPPLTELVDEDEAERIERVCMIRRHGGKRVHPTG